MQNVTADFTEHKPHYVRRLVWRVVNATVFRCAGGRIGWPLRRALLRIFGAKVHSQAYIYARCRIFMPWQLSIGRSMIGPRTVIYNKANVSIADHSVISQDTEICTGSHDIASRSLPLVTKPIDIGSDVWIAAGAFIAPGVSVADGAVVSARAAVFTDVEPYTVVRGNPAAPIRKRIITDK